MKEDYLWNGKGEDPEIRELETTLAAFRYRETAPPTLPAAKTAAVKTRRPAWRFSFAFACFAAAIVVAAIGVRFVTLPRSQAPNQTARVPEAAQIKPTETATTPTAPSVHSEPDKIVVPLIRNRPVYSGKAIYRTRRHHRLAPVKAKAIQRLTKEEVHAYRQLMRALAVTSSSLKVVRDSVRGVEPADISPNENHR